MVVKRNNESEETWKNVVFRLRKILFNVLMLLVTFNFDKGFELSISLMIEIQSKSIFHNLIITTI